MDRLRLVFPTSALHYTADIILSLSMVASAIAVVMIGVLLFA
jgi:hypothetical protein